MFTSSILGNVRMYPLTVTFKLSLAKDAGAQGAVIAPHRARPTNDVAVAGLVDGGRITTRFTVAVALNELGFRPPNFVERPCTTSALLSMELYV